jgi:hypothetical protein
MHEYMQSSPVFASGGGGGGGGGLAEPVVSVFVACEISCLPVSFCAQCDCDILHLSIAAYWYVCLYLYLYVSVYMHTAGDLRLWAGCSYSGSLGVRQVKQGWRAVPPRHIRQVCQDHSLLEAALRPWHIRRESHNHVYVCVCACARFSCVDGDAVLLVIDTHMRARVLLYSVQLLMQSHLYVSRG